MDREVIKRIEEAAWDGIILKLTNYAIFKTNRLYWKYRTLPQGLTPEDMVMEAINKMFEGKRKWNPSKNPDLYSYLKSVVDSDISHIYETKEYGLTQPFPETEERQEVEELLDRADPTSDHAIYLTPPVLNPEETLLEKEKIKGDEATVDLFFEAIKGDKKLEDLASLIMEGYTKPAEIAEQMGIDVKEVNNLQKRFRRKSKEFRNNIF